MPISLLLLLLLLPPPSPPPLVFVSIPYFFNDALRSSEQSVENESERTGKEVVVEKLKELYRHFPGRIEETTKNAVKVVGVKNPGPHGFES
jgi:hypothetical protein